MKRILILTPVYPAQDIPKTDTSSHPDADRQDVYLFMHARCYNVIMNIYGENSIHNPNVV